MADDREKALRYAPQIMFDEREPFMPRFIGTSILRSSGRSPSFRRSIEVPRGGFAVEYAVFWDWDIQHLYDLEHLWVFVDAEGAVADAEGSFHGQYIKILLPDRSNLSGDRVVAYSQPGKHAFAPLPVIFQLLPDFAFATGAGAGLEGALVTGPLEGRVAKEGWWDDAAREYLRARAFEPALEYRPYHPDPELFVTWEELDAALPSLFSGLTEDLAARRRCGRSGQWR
ncbi:MAG: hypothetical protein Q8M76_12215 [Spirochaetaceae bacterium]|nr:hypothetical protein [Spirochaetaceae bacterium]